MKTKFILVISLFLLSCSSGRNNDLKFVKVIRVIDGDTFVGRDREGEYIRIRMKYIDAPELGQNFGLAATYVLDSLIANKTVMLYITDTDKYGRDVAIVYYYRGDNNDRLNINEFMVKRGMAHVSEYYAPKLLYQEMLEAKKNKKGLWQNPYPINPWDFRKQNKN